AADHRCSGRYAGQSRFGGAEEHSGFFELEIRRQRDRHRHDRSISCQKIEFLAVASEERHALAALLGDLPWPLRRRSARSGRGVEWPYVHFQFSRLIRRVGHITAIGRETHALHLLRAAENFDRLPLARSFQWQSEQGAAAEVS